MALSEEKKQQRKDHILDVAEALTREKGFDTFSMRELAKAAAVSFATPFNLFGSKPAIYSALIERSIMEIAPTQINRDDPISGIFDASRLLIRKYAGDDYYKTLFISVTGSIDSLSTAVSIWTQSLQPLYESGVIGDEFEIDPLAEHMELQFVGSLILWLSGHLNDKAWENQYQYSIANALLGVTNKQKAREQLKGYLHEAEANLLKIRSKNTSSTSKKP